MTSRPGIRRGAAGWGLAVGAWLALTAGAQEESVRSTVPLSKSWSIASSGQAGSSGELVFRVTPAAGDPIEVTVFVLSGTHETGVATSIHRALSNQLDSLRFAVEAGQGAHVLVNWEEPSAAGRASPGFALELVDSDVDGVRVHVRSALPVAPPAVLPQTTPADPENTANPANPPEPGNPASPTAPGNAEPAHDPLTPDPQPEATPTPGSGSDASHDAGRPGTTPPSPSGPGVA